MEGFIRNIIREELSDVLKSIGISTETPAEDAILYNFDAGRAFGVNKLSKDINGLDQYYMREYFPSSEMKERWVFEIQTHYGASQLIEIVHELAGDHYGSHWSMKIAEVPRGSNVPEIRKDTGKIESYSNFIDFVNSNFEKDVNPRFL